MNEEKRISVVINTYNAEQHLQRVLDAVKDFDEVLICDMESTDSTLEIAEKNHCRVVTFPKAGHSIVEPAREFAIHEANCQWVLVIDADEVVTMSLRNYLYDVISKDGAPAGICIPRKNFFMGRFLHAAYPDYVLRFFLKDKTHWPPVIHCSPEVDGEVIRIPATQKEMALVHLANDSVSDIIRKSDTYSNYELTRRSEEDYGIGALIGRPLFRFVRSYFIKKGFLDGKAGLIHAMLEAFYQFSFVAKIIEKKVRH